MSNISTSSDSSESSHSSGRLGKMKTKMASKVPKSPVSSLHKISPTNLTTPTVVTNRMEARKVRKMNEEQLDIHYETLFLEDIIDEIATGDIFLMSGTELFSRVIKRACLTTWSHVCMAVVDPPRAIVQSLAIPDHWDSRVFIFESDTETWDKREGGGVQLVCLKAYLADCFEYYGTSFLFVWRKLQINHKQITNMWMDYPDLAEWMLKQKGKSYKTSKRELAGSALGMNLRQDVRRVFCSELIALAYFELDLLKKKENGGKKANNYLPRDFSSNQRIDGKDIYLLNDAHLIREKRLKMRGFV